MHFALVIHEFPVRACLAQHQLFSEAVKDLSDMAGSTPVEAKRELIQIAPGDAWSRLFLDGLRQAIA